MNRKQIRKTIPAPHRILLAKLAETTNMPLKYMQARYFAYEGDRQIFIADVRDIISGIQSGEYKLNLKTLELDKTKA